MARTMQSRSWASLSNAGEDLNVIKHEPIPMSEFQNNKAILLTIIKDLNTLQGKINRLDYLMKKREMEQNLYNGINE